jgi:DNA-binding NarL/FixJ family response regulator
MIEMRILIIEKQFHALQSLKALMDAWYQIIENRGAAYVCEALHVLEEFQPDVILMDVRMPKRSGLETIRLIKAKYQSIKIIVLSLDPDFRAEAMAAGVDAFVSKSDPPEKLREALADVLRECNWVAAATQSMSSPHLSWEPTMNCTNCEGAEPIRLAPVRKYLTYPFPENSEG